MEPHENYQESLERLRLEMKEDVERLRSEILKHSERLGHTSAVEQCWNLRMDRIEKRLDDLVSLLLSQLLRQALSGKLNQDDPINNEAASSNSQRD